MTMLAIYKQSNIYRILAQDFAKNSLSHTYMLLLPDKKLADEYARLFAMQLFCLDNHSACGECVNCKKILHDNMGDVKTFSKNTKLSVEESRQIVSDSLIKPYEMYKKLFVIKDFELATPQSQNALLKVLEEPTPTNIFLLVADNESTVLRTILSRAKKVVEHSVDNELLQKYLQETLLGADATVIKDSVELSRGNLTLSMDLVTNKTFQQLNKDILRVVTNLKGSGDVLKQSVVLSKYKDNLNEVLDIMLQTFLDIKIAITSNVIPARIKGLENQFGGYTPASITAITKVILESKNRLKFNCANVAVLDYLLFGILEAKFRCK